MDAEKQPSSSPAEAHDDKAAQGTPRTNVVEVNDDAYNNYIVRRNMYMKALTMVGLLVGGALVAIGHFLYYRALDGHDVHIQEWVLKVGTGLAFLYKALLGAATSMALVQMIWKVVATEAFSFQGLDRLFTVNSSVSGLLSFEVIRRAKIVTVFGICLVLIPLSGITPVSTLTVVRVPDVRKAGDYHCSPPNLDLRAQKPDVAQDSCDVFVLNSNGVDESTGFFNYTGRFNDSAEAKSLVTLSAFGGTILPMESACANGFSNCSYASSLEAPVLKCENVSWLSADAPWYVAPKDVSENNTRLFESRLQYTAELDGDGDIWLAWAAYKPEDIKYSPDGTPFRDDTGLTFGSDDSSLFDIFAAKCTLYNATYNLNVTVRSQVPTLDIKTNLIEAYNTTMRNFTDECILPLDKCYPGGNVPASGVKHRQDLLETWRAFGLMDTLYSQVLQGRIDNPSIFSSLDIARSTSNIVSTPLTEPWLQTDNQGVNTTNFYPIRKLSNAVEEVFRNITVSMLTRPNLVFKTKEDTSCILVHDINAWAFEQWSFWLSYGIGLALAACAVIVGILGMFEEGRARESSFTSIALATMDRRIENYVGNAPVAGASAPAKLENVKLTFDGRFKVHED